MLVLHGYTGSPASMRPLAEAFATAGLAVELPLLPGHGTTPAELARTTYADWLAAAEAAYESLAARCERVAVAGLSMGGALTLELAAAHPEIAGIVLVNPFVEPPAESFRTLLQAALAAGTTSVPSIGSDLKKQGVETEGYDETPIAPLLSLAEGLERLAPRLASVSCPVLLFSSRVDHVVPPESGDLVASSVRGPLQRVFLEESYHVATLDNDQPVIESGAVAFVERIGALA